MKTTVMILSVVLLMVLSGGAVLAAHSTPKEKGNRGVGAAVSLAKKHAVSGVVANKTDSGFDVAAKRGTLHVNVDGDTKYRVKGKEDGSLGDVVNGVRVNVRGARDGSNLLARQVHVIPSLGKSGHAVGQVVSFTAGSSITVRDKKTGQNREFALNADTRISLPEGQSSIQVDDRVMVVAKSLNSEGKPIARKIAVHGKESDED